MKHLITFIYLLFSPLSLHALNIDENSSNLSILEHSLIYIDTNNSINSKNINHQEFISSPSDVISLGYVKNTALWIKVTLKNTSSKSISKILEYDNPTVEKLYFYDKNKTVKTGLLHLNANKNAVNPIIPLSFKAYETQTYYLKSYSRIKPTKVKLILWNELDFIKKESKSTMFYFVFVGIMLTLFIYNFMLFLFTKDRAYFFYIFYIFSIMFYNAFYSGRFSQYFTTQELTNYLLKANGSFTIMIVFSSLLFTQSFLETKKFNKLHKALNHMYWILPFLVILSYDAWIINASSHYVVLLIGLFIIYVAFYSLFKGVKQAKFYVLGWSIIVVSFMLIAFQWVLHYDLKDYNLTYVSEVAFILEALLFSIALAHRIKLSNKQLILFKNEEQVRLEAIVTQKTKALKTSLEEKDILYKELNHRIKNNLMMILSLLKLQIKRTENKETIGSLVVTKNRITSISNLYEMLLLNNTSLNVDTYPYVKGICQNIALNFSNKVNIHYEINYNLKIDNLIYLGLIVNELVTNSFKYAFDDDKGKIFITIKKDNSLVFVSIIDTGKGFQERRKNALGLSIVSILVEGQLEGKLTIDSKNSTKVFIEWNDENL
ncbi:MAG: Sensory transduction histidine kinase [uncultured Sulfurovum sp.]|uniref:histidine kinase n=1 Tax=uncultured Sulfurovum sp. TaxID=269237 RepID=A0A6S6S6S9_9BACT|nr:MAG: Sensory transduction histidine kinase [uncultured Sulfurovum sp.]